MYCFSLFCRLCFRRDCKLLNLFTKDEDMITYSEKLKSCIPEIISDDDRVPNFICDNCCIKLRKGYEFKTMCIKNHIALRDYAKNLLKYMENPTTNQNILNMKLNTTDENDVHDGDRLVESENDSECSEETHQIEYQQEELNNSLDEPLALVKSDRKNQVENSESSQQFSTHTSDDVQMNDIKNEEYSDDDSDDYQCEDLSNKPRLVIDEDRDSKDVPQNLPQNNLPGYNAQNSMAINYLKLEYSERDDASHTNDTRSNDQPKNLSIADSETEQEDHCTWNTTVREESSKKMKTRTKDKYRIVYTENQRLELEKEFIVSRYITTSRKMQLSTTLNLSQRQIKIWFQNRRAKERKQVKRTVEQLGGESTETPDSNRNLEQAPVSPPLNSYDVMSQILKIQHELFLLQRQKEDPKDFDDVCKIKIKEDLFHKRLQVLIQQQNELKSRDSEKACK